MRFIVLFFIGMSSAIYSQVPYNIRLDNDLSQAQGKIVHELEYSYLCIGRGFNSGTSVGEGVFATEIDKNTGEVLYNTRFEIAGQTLFFNNIKSGVSIDEDFYFIAHRGLNFHLLRYNQILKEIISVKVLSPEISTQVTFQYDFQYRDGKFYILSPVKIGTTNKNSLLIIKYDLENDIQTEILIDDDNIDPSWGKMKILPSGNYLISYSTDEDFRRLFIQEIDLDGNEVWNSGYPVALNGSSTSTLHSIDNNQIFIGGFNARLPTNSEPILVPAIFKFDKHQLKFTATSKFDLMTTDYNDWNSGIREITPTRDSLHYLCIAELYNIHQDPDTLIGKGMVAKVDTNLNTIWRRSYRILDNNFVEHHLEDIIPTSDGNYLCYGRASYWNIPPGEIPILSWVFKIDEDGKIIGDTTTATVDWIDEELIDQIEVFPNPASDMIYINQNEIDHVSYQVYDIDGRLEDEFSIDHKNESVMKPIDRWKKGYKIIRMLRDGRLIGSMKVLKI